MASRFISPTFDAGPGVKPASGAKLFFKETGTSTDKDTFTTAAADIANANPVIADSNGVFPDIFISGTYKVILTDKNDVQVGFGEKDPVTSEGSENFDTVVDLKLSRLSAGTLAKTIDYYSTQRGGGAEYLVKTAAQASTDGDVIDEFANHTLANGNVAILQFSLFVLGRQVGMITDTSDSSAAFDAGYALAKLKGVSFWVGPGEFHVNIITDGHVPVFGSGKKGTTLRPFSDATAIVKIQGSGAANLEASLSDMTLDGFVTGTAGLELGTTTLGNGFSNGTLRRIDVKNCVRNIEVFTMTNCIWDLVYSFSASEEALFIGSERSVQLTTWINCRFRLSKIGGQIQSGNRLTFIGTNFESNTDTGLVLLRTNSSGPSYITFIQCWLENNGGNPVTATGDLVTSLRLDMLSGTQATNVHNIDFIGGNITGATNGASGATNTAFDVTAARSKGVEFRKVSFSPEFDATRFAFSGTGQVFARLIDCGGLNEAPSPTLYASFPPMTVGGGSASLSGTQGFEYSFRFDGYDYSNKKVFEVAANPNGSLTAFAQEQVVFDGVNFVYYKSLGKDSTGWVRISDPFQVNVTTTELADIGGSINTRDKFEGKQVFDTVLNQPLWAVGSAASSTWRDAQSVTVVTPV